MYYWQGMVICCICLNGSGMLSPGMPLLASLAFSLGVRQHTGLESGGTQSHHLYHVQSCTSFCIGPARGSLLLGAALEQQGSSTDRDGAETFVLGLDIVSLVPQP